MLLPLLCTCCHSQLIKSTAKWGAGQYASERDLEKVYGQDAGMAHTGGGWPLRLSAASAAALLAAGAAGLETEALAVLLPWLADCAWVRAAAPWVLFLFSAGAGPEPRPRKDRTAVVTGRRSAAAAAACNITSVGGEAK
jgi:hypothetical protein